MVKAGKEEFVVRQHCCQTTSKKYTPVIIDKRGSYLVYSFDILKLKKFFFLSNLENIKRETLNPITSVNINKTLRHN